MARKNSWNWTKAIDLPMAVAALLTIAFYVIVNQESLKGSLIHRYTTEHFVEYVVVTFFIWGLVDVVFRVCGFPLELVALREETFPTKSTRQPVSTAAAMLEQLSQRPKWFLDSRLGQRMTHALGYLTEKGSAEGFEDYLRHLADQDEEKTYTNYGLIRFICWVTPVLGILGTVIHFGSAFGGMSVDEIGDKLAIVLGEIGNAFHTTTVALAAAISMMFSLYLCERTERGIVRRINRRVDRELLSRFEVVDEKLTPFINAVEVANHASLAALDESVHRQLQIWSGAFHSLQHENEQKLQSHSQLWEQSLLKMHERFEQSDTQREQKLLRLLGELQLQRSEQKTQTQAMVTQMAGLQSNFSQLVEALQGLNRDEGELVKLQQTLTANLQALRGSQQLDQALHGMTAAIHLLTARYEPEPKAKSSRAA